jgi:hypothetical protein
MHDDLDHIKLQANSFYLYGTLLPPSGPGKHSWYGDSLEAGWSGDWILVGARFSTSIQASPRDPSPPASCTIRTGSFPGVKLPGREASPPPPSGAGANERVQLYIYPLFGPNGLYRDPFTFLFSPSMVLPPETTLPHLNWPKTFPIMTYCSYPPALPIYNGIPTA